VKEALAVVLLLAAARVAPGDESPLVADRPGFGESAHETSSSPSLSLGRSLGRHLGTFLEYGANLAQLDASLGVALSPAAPDFFLGAGFCHRF
jgi:hypothetical protein